MNDLQEGEAFVAAADSYVRKYLLRGIPSLFSGTSGASAPQSRPQAPHLHSAHTRAVVWRS